MAQAREKGGRVVFIGNIPYGFSEEQICELFSACGQVVSFRLVYDKDTNRPKGFGFLEYTSPDSAAAAVRNLNEHEVSGRTLRVDYSNDNDKGGKTDPLAMPIPGQPIGAPGAGILPPLPAGREVAPGVTAPDAISETVSSIPAPQLLDILSQMKALVTSDPAKATALLQQAPQLGFALFQALLLLNLVSTETLTSLVASTQGAPPPQQPPPQAMPQPPYQQMPPGYPSQPPFGQPGYPPNYATPPPVVAHHPPPQQQPGYGMPHGVDPQLLDTVRHLTKQQIMTLEEPARNEIIRIRVAMGLPPVPN